MSKGFLNLQGMPAAAMGRGEAGRVTQRWDTYEEVRAEAECAEKRKRTAVMRRRVERWIDGHDLKDVK
jgi:hypothetical protein